MTVKAFILVLYSLTFGLADGPADCAPAAGDGKICATGNSEGNATAVPPPSSGGKSELKPGRSGLYVGF